MPASNRRMICHALLRERVNDVAQKNARHPKTY